MDSNLLLIFVLTFIIHMIGTLAYSVRIAGTRTKRIAISLSLFNILILISRVSNSFQSPLLAKRVEENIMTGALSGMAIDFRWLIFAATLATIAGAILIPTFQRIFSKAVVAFNKQRSIPKLLLHSASPTGINHIRNSLRFPSLKNLTDATKGGHIPVKILVFNTIAMAIWTVGVFSSLYAGYLEPELRVTASQLSAVINGFATILLFVFIDPHLSMLTDEVAEGEKDAPFFRRSVVWLVGSRLAGTVVAQVLFIPAAMAIAFIAKLI